MTPEQLAAQAGITLAQAKLLQTVQPGITVAQAKAQVANGAQPTTAAPSTGTSADLMPGFKNQPDAGAAVVWTIPVWRSTDKRLTKHIGENGEESFTRAATNHPLQHTADDASVQFGVLMMDKAKLEEWGKLARITPGLGIDAENINDVSALGKAWDKAIGWAVNIKQATNGSTELTPFEAAKMVSRNMGGQLLAQQADAAAHFTGNRTHVTTTTNQDANSQTGDVLHQLLGRNPTAGEKATYQHGLNQVAAANPTVTNSVDTFKNGVNTGTVNTVTGGYDEKAAAIQEASSASPEVAKNQQATVFYDALVKAIGAAV